MPEAGQPITTMLQVILRKESASAPSFKEAAEKLGRAFATIVDERASSLLVEGEVETLCNATVALKGPKTIPMKRYSVPDACEKIALQPATVRRSASCVFSMRVIIELILGLRSIIAMSHSACIIQVHPKIIPE